MPHVAEHFYGTGLANTLSGLSDFVQGKKTLGTYWIAYQGESPFAFLITSKVDPSDEHFGKYCNKDTRGITLDLAIGDVNFLGKGLANPLIHTFLEEMFPEVTDVFIDPSQDNERAIHVYKKAGFEVIGEFIAPWAPKPHYQMRKRMK